MFKKCNNFSSRFSLIAVIMADTWLHDVEHGTQSTFIPFKRAALILKTAHKACTARDQIETRLIQFDVGHSVHSMRCARQVSSSLWWSAAARWRAALASRLRSAEGWGPGVWGLVGAVPMWLGSSGIGDGKSPNSCSMIST